MQLFFGVVYLIIAILTSNVMVIPTFEFLSFPFLKYKNPFSHLDTFNYIFEDEKFNTKDFVGKNKGKTNLCLILISICYIYGFFSGLFSNSAFIKNVVEFLILSFVYVYYLVIIFCYINISIYAFIKNPLKFKNKILPNINLLNYSLNPIYKDNYKENENIQISENFLDIRNIMRIILLILSILVAIFFSVINSRSLGFSLFHILFICSIFILSIVLNFPFCYKNSKGYGGFFNSKITLKKNAKSKKPIMVSAIRFISDILFILISSILFLSFFFMKENLNEDFIDFDNFAQIFENKIESKNHLLPSICNSKIYNLPIYLYIPFINDAYYYNKINGKKTSFEYGNYKKIFFDKNYIIKPIGNLINESEGVKMVRYDVQNEKENINVTILSIKGTSHKKDLYMDLQLFMPSVFLNLLSTFSLFGNEMESFIYKIVEYSLSIPYRMFGEFLFINKYIKDLVSAYNETSKSISENVVIVGHSLGGGLSKILGRITKNQAISLSGPGINAFHTLWTSDGNSENFDLSFIDLVPDYDLVPRVEVSGGTIYRIFCNQGPFICHDKTLSLCEALAMCRSNYYEFYCYKIAYLNTNQIKEILNSSDLKRKNN